MLIGEILVFMNWSLCADMLLVSMTAMIISIQTNTILLDQYIGLFLYLYKKRPIYWSTILLQSHDMNVCRPTYKILVHGETSFQIDCWRNVALLHVVQL